MTSTHHIQTTNAGGVGLTTTERGEGHPFLLLHGGRGPDTVTAFADLLADREHAHVLTPTHPGFGTTTRPDALRTIPQLAELYIALLDEMDLQDVTIVGNSIGGWIAAEMALGGAEVRASSLILVDAVGLEVPGRPVADFFALTMPEVFARSFHDPSAFAVDPASLPPERQQIMASNRATLAVYAADGMTDPTLAARLTDLTLPSLVIWGESDRIADPDYGRAYAAAIPGSEFALLTNTGHMPQVETPKTLLPEVWAFADRHATRLPG